MFVTPGASFAMAVAIGGCVDDKLISIRTGPGRVQDQRCKRPDCVFPQPTLRFDLESGRVIAAWSWPGVRVIDVANGVRVTLVPTMLLVPISCN